MKTSIDHPGHSKTTHTGKPDKMPDRPYKPELCEHGKPAVPTTDAKKIIWICGHEL